MTDRCEPPPEFRHEPYHWVESHKDGMGVCQFGIIPDVIQPDLRDYCRITSTRFVTFLTPQEACELGWRYVAPCLPDDAEERIRLKAENIRLRAALHVNAVTHRPDLSHDYIEEKINAIASGKKCDYVVGS